MTRHVELFTSLEECPVAANNNNTLFNRIRQNVQPNGYLSLGSPHAPTSSIDEYVAAYMMIVDQAWGTTLVGIEVMRQFRQICMQCRDAYNRQVDGRQDPVREAFRSTWDQIEGGNYTFSEPPDTQDPLLAGIDAVLVGPELGDEEQEEDEEP